MTLRLPFSDRYKWPLRIGFLWVIYLGFCSATIMDMGESVVVFYYTVLGYATLLLMILLRRPVKPTRADLLILKWGFPILYFGGFMMYNYVWQLRGFR